MIKTVTFHPSRIGCPSIPGTMKGMVISLKGVRDVKVHYEDRSLDVTFDDAETSEDAIVKRVGGELGIALQPGKPSDGVGVAETCPM